MKYLYSVTRKTHEIHLLPHKLFLRWGLLTETGANQPLRSKWRISRDASNAEKVGYFLHNWDINAATNLFCADTKGSQRDPLFHFQPRRLTMNFLWAAKRKFLPSWIRVGVLSFYIGLSSCGEKDRWLGRLLFGDKLECFCDKKSCKVSFAPYEIFCLNSNLRKKMSALKSLKCNCLWSASNAIESKVIHA